MKGKIIATAIIALFLAVVAASAQTAKPNFAGDWTLDADKSKFPDTMQIESMTMRVAQTGKELKIESTREMLGNAAGRRGAKTNSSESVVYNLDNGKLSESQIGSGIMTGKETRQAKFTDDGKLSLIVTRTFDNEMGKVTTKTSETWEFADDGETLKVTRYDETPRGATNAEMYFTRKGIRTAVAPPERGIGGEPVTDRDNPVNVQGAADNSGKTPKIIDGGIVNGKALSLPKPNYPPAARAVKASGTVNVQVTVDEQGNIISASAVSGHPLLRAAAEEAARKAQFAPTRLNGIPIKFTGILVYNFAP